MKLKQVNLLIIAFLVSLQGLAQRTNQAYWTYIDKYKDWAMEQMRDYQIPASITLAQGLLESNADRSTLATQANNHFGIKVGSSWTGPYVLRNDDAPNEKFRKYNSARESYIDHSKFLHGRRYQGLFQLNIRDYKGWARGLKAAGGSDFFNRHMVYKNNKNYFIIVELGDNMATISKETGISLKHLYEYNDLPKDYWPTQGDVLYMKKKQKCASKEFKKYPIHIVEVNQSMFDIAQLYGMRLENLYKLNKLNLNYTPQVGDILRIR